MIELVIYAFGILLALYMAWCLGANDAANPTECAVGAGVISLKKALILFAIFAALGGILIGPFVMKTIDRGLVDRDAGLRRGELTREAVIIGSLTAALSATLWITFSTWRGMPVSTTHSIVGGVLGFGFIMSPHLMKWDKIGLVGVSIAASPLASIFLAATFFFLFRRYFEKIRTRRSILTLTFLLIFGLCFATSATVLHKALKWKDLVKIIYVASIVSVSASAISTINFSRQLKKLKNPNHLNERTMAYMLIIALAFSAFAFGGNDMANSTGVFVTPTEIIAGKPTFETMLLLALLGSAFIGIGGFTWGYRVINTTAYRIVRLNPITGLSAEFSNALVVFIFTVLPKLLIGFGIPVSTTQASVGSLIGVGLASKGLTAIQRATTCKVLAFWILTIPCVALISMGLFKLFSQVVAIV